MSSGFYGYRCLFAVFSAVILVPDISMTGKAIYSNILYDCQHSIYRTYTLSAILPLMTLSPKERLVLNSPANDQANWGFINERDRLAVSRFLGNGDDHAGFIYTAITFAIISCALTRSLRLKTFVKWIRIKYSMNLSCR